MNPVAIRRLIHGLAAVGQARKAVLQAGEGLDAAHFEGGRALQREHLEGKGKKTSDKRRKKNKKKKKPPLGTGERFKELEEELEEKDTRDPKAVAAWIGRSKHGKAKMSQMPARGRARKSLNSTQGGGASRT